MALLPATMRVVSKGSEWEGEREIERESVEIDD
jgi:hypothetical protein